MASPASAQRGSRRIALGAWLLVASGLLLMRAAGPWPGDAVAWPVLVAVAGALLIWRSPIAVLPRRRGWAAHRGLPRHAKASEGAASLARAPVARLLPFPRPQVSRRGVGVTLVLAAGIAALWANGAIQPAGEAVLTGFVVLVAVALIFAPSWRRLARSLAAEREERVRTQERADVGAHLHDSVLQTLALIQRSAGDPKRVAALARTQERELREWLAGEEPARAAESFGDALKVAAAELEDAAGAAIEVVVVGEGGLDEPALVALAATKEAMLNAAKFAGEGPVSVFAEISPERIAVFVRDRGRGFELAAVPEQRRGVRESIIGRMQRAGGSAQVRSTPGSGTEVELVLERGRRG